MNEEKFINKKTSLESNLVDLSEILKECLWCPTPDNIQNWKFHIDNNKLVVEIDKDQWSHPIDFANHSALISLGGLSFYIQVAAAQSGLAAHYKLKTSPQFRLEVWFETDQINEKYLQYFSCLRKRRTDRRSYKIGAFDASLYEGLMGLSFSERVDLSIVQNPSKNFFNYLEKTEQLMWSDFSIMKATMSLIDFSGVTPKVGFSSQNVGLSKIESRMMAWLGRHPDLLKAFLNYGMAKMGARKTSFPYKHSDGFLLFSASEVSLPAIFEVGRAAIESWLYLTQFGGVAQPLTLSSFSIYQSLIDPHASKLIEESFSHFQEGQVLLESEFSIEKEKKPVWLLRIGKVDSEIPLSGTDRLHPEDFFGSGPPLIQIR